MSRWKSNFNHSSLHHWKDKFRRYIEKPSPTGVQNKLQTPAAAAEPPLLPSHSKIQIRPQKEMLGNSMNKTWLISRSPNFCRSSNTTSILRCTQTNKRKKSLKIVSNQPNLHFFQNLLSKTNLHFFATQNSSFCSHLNQLLDQLHMNSTRITPTIPSFLSPSKTATTLHLNEHLGATELPNTWTCKHLAPKNSETPW